HACLPFALNFQRPGKRDSRRHLHSRSRMPKRRRQLQTLTQIKKKGVKVTFCDVSGLSRGTKP
ncbi:MAG: hypothetical protein WBA92_15220, partial [Pseudorhodobacter sp.]